MSREFNVPPVIFPSGGNPNTGPQRRLPTAPFQPSRSSNPSIPFIIGGGSGSANFDDEPPLLEELGINTKQIWNKTASILNPFRVKADLHEDADLSGRNGNLDLYRCLSLIGYCMLPIVILSAVALFVPQGGLVIFVMMGIFVIWSTRVCTRLLVELASCGDEHRGLIASLLLGM
ncbi:unnamed protein product [Lactuca saligna]|uniref:Protein YIP n=1 Tax=Lactuca saligna TaxID=75948 RepID=A0AA35ZPY8_LACSI|nr:unnamed protein product [Lactuca saligna]